MSKHFLLSTAAYTFNDEKTLIEAYKIIKEFMPELYLQILEVKDVKAAS